MNHLSFKINEQTKKSLYQRLQKLGFEFKNAPYSFWRAKNPNFNVSIQIYNSYKCLIQGKQTKSFCSEYLYEWTQNYLSEKPSTKVDNKDSHDWNYDCCGTDESGKGDYFGALVVCAAIIPKSLEEDVKNLSIQDSKTLTDTHIINLAIELKNTIPYELDVIMPADYNKSYEQHQNLNKLLSASHAYCIKSLYQKVPFKIALVDQFSVNDGISVYLKDINSLKINQQVRAEEKSLAVAAASILARDAFIKSIEQLSSRFEITLPKGGGNVVNKAARNFVKKEGFENLNKVAKLHFKNTQKINLI